MRKHDVPVMLGLLALVLLPASGCGSESEDETPGGAGTGATGTGDSGGTGAATGGGGTGGIGAAGSGASGGSGGAGTGGTETAGSGGTGGDPNLGDRIFVACTNWQSNGFVHGCLAVFGATYVSDCVAEWTQAAENCAAEVEAVLDCGNMLPVLDYECDADGDVTFAPGVCESETAALDQCVVGSP